MFDRDYPMADIVNTSVSRIGNQMLEAEIMRHRSMMAQLDVNQQKQKQLKLEVGTRVAGAQLRYVSAAASRHESVQPHPG